VANCAEFADHLNLTSRVLSVDFAVGVDGAELYEKDTKDHKDRRIVLDDFTAALLRAYLIQCEQRAPTLGITLARTCTCSPQCPTTPSRTGRHRCPADTAGWRRGSPSRPRYIGSGTTRRPSSSPAASTFVSEADQRAASTLLARLPKPPVEIESDETLRRTVEPPARGPSTTSQPISKQRSAAVCSSPATSSRPSRIWPRGTQSRRALSTAHFKCFGRKG
jgi:integrase